MSTIGRYVIGWIVASCFFAASIPGAVSQEDSEFHGKITAGVSESIPSWPHPLPSPKGAPNIAIILLDDIGFADTATFGGIAQTPHLSALAARGLRYINFNTTATCSPTRAALLSGRNHHRVGFGVAESEAGFPGYDFIWKKSAAPIPEILRRNGYSTAAFGKWHNTPSWEISSVGPFDRWPTSLGFDSFYGFMGGKEDEWEPSSLYRGTTPVEPPKTPERAYHMTTDLADEAIRWLQTHDTLAPDKPYFLYFATGAVHTPHQAPREWIDQYRGQFDAGWDRIRADIFARQKRLGVIPTDAELTPRPPEVPAWSSLSADQRKLYARQMEVYAGFISHTDFEVGRVLEAMGHGPHADNTIILYIVGDNGSCAEGGVDGFTDALTSVGDQLKRVDDLGGPSVASNIYSAGWAWMGATPFKGWKWVASYFGGVRNPLIVSWPARIKDAGRIRGQFTHVNDVAATLYEVTGVPVPSSVDGIEQLPLDGVSFAPTFDHPDAPSLHHTQYFETIGNRAIYHEGWVAAATHELLPWKYAESGLDFTRDRWELYHVEKDFSESHDLAKRFPNKLNELRDLFDREARRNDVYPLGAVMAVNTGKPSIAGDRSEFVYYPGQPRFPRTAMPALSGKSYRISVHAVIPDAATEGVLLSYGGRESGFALYTRGDRLFYVSNRRNEPREVIESDVTLPRGEVTLSFEYTQEMVRKGTNVWAGDVDVGIGRLFIGQQEVGRAKLEQALGFGYFRSLGIGQAFGSPVSEEFRPPFRFTGVIRDVKITLN